MYINKIERKLRLFNKLAPEAFGIINLTLEQICQAMAVKYKDPRKIWTGTTVKRCRLRSYWKRWRGWQMSGRVAKVEWGAQWVGLMAS